MARAALQPCPPVSSIGVAVPPVGGCIYRLGAPLRHLRASRGAPGQGHHVCAVVVFAQHNCVALHAIMLGQSNRVARRQGIAQSRG